MTLLSSWRQRLARAVERGDPRLGLGVGAVLSLLSAWAFVAGLGLARRADNALMDSMVQWRPPIRESPQVLLVDKNDQTYKELRWPITREQYGQVVLALDRLGARQIVFDVEFKTSVARPGEEFDPSSGDYVLRNEDRVLRHALGVSGRVTLAYHLEMRDPLSPELRRRFPEIREFLARRFTAGSEELATSLGLPHDLLKKEFYELQKGVAESLMGDLLRAKAGLSFPDARREFLPDELAKDHPGELKILHYGYWLHRGTEELLRKASLPRVEGRPPEAPEVHGIVPPFFPFLQHAHAAAPANADADPDGVLRHPWACLYHRGRPLVYLGLEGGLLALAKEGDAVETVIEPRRMTIRPRGPGERSFKEVVLPTDREGRILINWAGNRVRARGQKEVYFEHVPFHALVGFFEDRYFLMDDNFRARIAKMAEERGEPYHAEYLRLGDRMRDALLGKAEMAPEEARKVEAAMDSHRKEILAEHEKYAAEIQEGLPALASKRARENSEKELRNVRALLAGLRASYDREAQLRPLVEGKVCWIGSASTAGGDLHATPLGHSTPGVDVLANLSNMVLTGQVMRHVPGWLDFAYLVAVGMLVSLAVTYGRTTWSALASLGLVAASLGLYAALFVGPMILVSGAGPPGTALVVFAGVTAFKELVTDRSRRKLQKELVKNTSPELVEILMEHPELLRQPRKMTGTFLFSDIKSFTSFSEKMTPEVLVPYVNRYLDRTTRSLKRHKGYLDKYIGDGIMALFGVPVASDDHARNACRAALENQALLVDLNKEYERDGLPVIRTRIGVNTGEVIAGYVGAEERSDYTVLGDAVNLASRLEGANKEYSTWIMVSEFTHRLVASEFVFRELDRIRVVGKRNAVGIYELVAEAGAPLPFPAAFLDAYAAALALFRERKWNEAIEGFGKALALRPGDKPSETYVARAQAFRVTPPPPDWEGVFELSSK